MSSRVILGGLLVLSLGAVAILAVLYRGASSRQAQLESEKASICNSHASRLATILADGTDLRAQLRPIADQFISQMCLGTPTPLGTDNGNVCWVETGKDSCFRPVGEKLLPMYSARGWK